MKYRKLRIACSVACLGACLLLCALWARSYYFADQVFMRVSQLSAYNFVSVKGQLQLRREIIETPGVGFYGNMRILEWVFNTFPAAPILKSPTRFGFNLRSLPYFIAVPYWTPLLVCVVLAAMPVLFRRRFSLRTLFIATTLVAVALGLIVWAVRAG